MPALVTQRSAIKLLKVTGRSLAWRRATAKRLATVHDGSRLKIREQLLDATIRAENEPVVVKVTNGMRGFSQRKINSIRERAA